jgi:hypothetical protein
MYGVHGQEQIKVTKQMCKRGIWRPVQAAVRIPWVINDLVPTATAVADPRWQELRSPQVRLHWKTATGSFFFLGSRRFMSFPVFFLKGKSDPQAVVSPPATPPPPDGVILCSKHTWCDSLCQGNGTLTVGHTWARKVVWGWLGPGPAVTSDISGCCGCLILCIPLTRWRTAVTICTTCFNNH